MQRSARDILAAANYRRYRCPKCQKLGRALYVQDPPRLVIECDSCGVKFPCPS